MTQRPTAPTERARACPFLAFEDDRDMRSDRPDHRHRCFAEKRPAPRAIAHQEAFCLSPAFPSCPTFQDWARREAAQARNSSAAAAGPGASVVPSGMAGGRPEPGDAAARRPDDQAEEPADLGLIHDDEPADQAARADQADETEGQDGAAWSHELREHLDPDDDEEPGYEPPEPGWLPDVPAVRNASRSWAAPPPWAGAGGSGTASRPGRSSGADRADEDALPAAGLASSRWLSDVKPGDELDGDDGDDPLPRDAGRVGSRQRPDSSSVTPSFLAGRGTTDDARDAGDAGPDRELAALVTRNRPAGSPPRRDPRPMAGQARPARRQQQPPAADAGPSWERPRRFEAYPTLKTRVGMPAVPRIAVGLGALVVAAVLVFMIPALLFNKAGTSASPTPSVSVAPSVSLVPTASAAPTPTTYTIKKGDNLLKIAKSFGVTQAQILTANPQIKDPNKIKIGDVIVIPLATPSEIIDSSSPSPSPEDSGSTAP